MSAAASTSSAKASRRFWTSRLKDAYGSCVLPTVTACAASPTSCSNTFSKSTERKSSWSQTTLTPPSGSSRTTSYRSSRYLARAFTGAGPPEGSGSAKKPKVVAGPAHFETINPLKEGQAFRTLSVKMLPTSHQMPELRRWFGAATWSYNEVVAAVKKEGVHPNNAPLWSDVMARGKVKFPGVIAKVRKRAIKQAAEAFATNERKKAKNPRHKYSIKYRSRKGTRTQVVVLEKAYFESEEDRAKRKKPPHPSKTINGKVPKDTGPVMRIHYAPSPSKNGGKKIYADVLFGGSFTKFGPVRIFDRVGVIDALVADGCLLEDGQMIWDRSVNSFHLLVRIRRSTPEDPDPEGKRKTIVALDPGCRAFNTYYDPSGRHGELLCGTEAEIKRRCKRIDSLCSQRAKVEKSKTLPRRKRHRRRRRVRKTLARERRRLHNWTKNAHYDAANFLLERYDVILAPTFAVKDMAKRNKRVFTSKVARSMYNWSHYTFRQRLKSKAFDYAGRVVVEVGEPGTSKTCGFCGAWKADLGGNKVYKCMRCKTVMDRDVNGARNNLLAAYGIATGFPWDGTE